MSATDILRTIGKSTETSDLVRRIADKPKVSERHAYRLLKMGWKAGEIRKATLPDRSRVNFLPEWGSLPGSTSEKPRETLDFREAFLYRCFKQLEEISQQAVYGPIEMWGEPCKALQELLFLIARLPKEIKDKIEPIKRKTLKKVAEKQQKFLNEDEKSSFSTERRNEPREEYESECLHAVRILVDRVSTLLHENQVFRG